MGATKNGDSEYVDVLGKFSLFALKWAIWPSATVLQGPMGGLQGGLSFLTKDGYIHSSPKANSQNEDELPKRRGGAVSRFQLRLFNW